MQFQAQSSKRIRESKASRFVLHITKQSEKPQGLCEMVKNTNTQIYSGTFTLVCGNPEVLILKKEWIMQIHATYNFHYSFVT